MWPLDTELRSSDLVKFLYMVSRLGALYNKSIYAYVNMALLSFMGETTVDLRILHIFLVEKTVTELIL